MCYWSGSNYERFIKFKLKLYVFKIENRYLLLKNFAANKHTSRMTQVWSWSLKVMINVLKKSKVKVTYYLGLLKCMLLEQKSCTATFSQTWGKSTNSRKCHGRNQLVDDKDYQLKVGYSAGSAACTLLPYWLREDWESTFIHQGGAAQLAFILTSSDWVWNSPPLEAIPKVITLPRWVGNRGFRPKFLSPKRKKKRYRNRKWIITY